MIMTGDDIRNCRIEAEKYATATGAFELPAQQVLALWVIAEQLHEIRMNCDTNRGCACGGHNERDSATCRMSDLQSRSRCSLSRCRKW